MPHYSGRVDQQDEHFLLGYKKNTYSSWRTPPLLVMLMQRLVGFGDMSKVLLLVRDVAILHGALGRHRTLKKLNLVC